MVLGSPFKLVLAIAMSLEMQESVPKKGSEPGGASCLNGQNNPTARLFRLTLACVRAVSLMLNQE